MGLFDRVYLDCPDPFCDKRIEFQSKAHDCYLEEYDGDGEIPIEIAIDLDNTYGTCKCGVKVLFRYPHAKNVYVEYAILED